MMRGTTEIAGNEEADQSLMDYRRPSSADISRNLDQLVYRDGFKVRNSINLPQFTRLLAGSRKSLIRIIFPLASPALRSFTHCRGRVKDIVSELDASIS